MRQVVRQRLKEANNVDDTRWFYSCVIDGNNLIKIALVNTEHNNTKGECYGAVVNFLRMLGDILRKKDFNQCCCFWDGEGSGVMRYRIYKDYKANRDKNYAAIAGQTDYDKAINNYVKKVLNYSRTHKPEVKRGETEEESFDRQKRIVQQILEELCIRQYEFNNVEGDDLIAYYVKNKPKNEKVVLVSTDKDLTQLISDTVCVWNPRKRLFVTDKNSVDVLGITHENIVLQKIFCGDASDNIYGIKGMGEATFLKHFPEAVSKKFSISEIIERSKVLLDERKEAKKKPLKVLENVINKITDGSQGERIYDVNKAIIDLSEPLLSNEASTTLKDELYAPMDVSNRSIGNIYGIIEENGMVYLQDEKHFGDIFGPYSRIIEMERKNTEKNIG